MSTRPAHLSYNCFHDGHRICDDSACACFCHAELERMAPARTGTDVIPIGPVTERTRRPVPVTEG